MIIEIKGCTGAGKSTIVRELLGQMKAGVFADPHPLNIEAYEGGLHGKKIAVLGSYHGGAEIHWGGLESHLTQDKMLSLLDKYAQRANVVIMEGGHISKTTGKVHRALTTRYRSRYRPLWLDTKTEECYDALRSSPVRHGRRWDTVVADMRQCRKVQMQLNKIGIFSFMITRKTALFHIHRLIQEAA